MTVVTWEQGAVAFADEVRIELTAIGPPPPAQIAAAVAAAEVGRVPTSMQPHTATRGIDRYLVLDARGVRHLDQTPRWRFLRRRMNPMLTFAVEWAELRHVALQIQRSQRTPLVMLRLVLTPVDPEGFAARRPELSVLRNLTGLDASQWALSLGLDDHVNEYVLSVVRDGLRRFAGPRLFIGDVDPPG